MKSTDDIERLIKNSRYKATTEAYNKTLHSFRQSVDDYIKQKSALTEPKTWRIIMNSRITQFAVAAIIIAAVMVGMSQLGGSIDGTSVAWAEVMRNFKQQLHTNDFVHLVITNHKPIHGDDLGFGDVIKTEEIWVQRPFNMRIEEVYQVNNAPDYITFTPTTSIYNEEGEFQLVHNRKRWGFRDANLINVRHKVTYRE